MQKIFFQLQPISQCVKLWAKYGQGIRPVEQNTEDWIKRLEEKTTLVIGGCRSGKSDYALNAADRIKGRNKIFIATSVPTDKEMEKRVTTHQQQRGENWHTVEEPIYIDEKIREYSGRSDVILVDCLTLWVSNLMMDMAQKNSPTRIETAVEKLVSALDAAQCPVFLVSNEVGTGIVPENRLARQFRDHAGFVNRKIAAAADQVVLTVAGIDVTIKPKS